MKKYLLTLFGAILLFNISCTKDSTDSSPKKNVQDRVSEFKETMKEKIDKVDDRIHELEGRLKDSSEAGRENLQKRVAELKDLRGELKDKLDNLGESTSEKFTRAKKEIKRSYETLKKKAQEALE